jgi:hypothetical protein
MLGLGADPRQQAIMAAPSFFDRILGRGSYIDEFTSRRGRIIDQSRMDKRRLRRDWRRQKDKYMDKLDRGDVKTYQHFNIRQSQRATKPGLEKKEEEKLFRETVKKIEQEMREDQREALRGIERQRDAEIRKMRDELRERLYSTSD